MKIIKNVNIYDFQSYSPRSFVAFKEKIIMKGSMKGYNSYMKFLKENRVETEVIEGHGALLMPGLTLGHSHMYSTFARGWNTPFHPNSFQDILDQLWWKLDATLGKEEIYYSGLTSALLYLKKGITTVIDHHASGKLILGSLETLKEAVVDEMGLRGILCFETSDRFDVEKCIEENSSFYHKMKINKNQDCSGLLGLHASFTLSDNSLGALSKTIRDMPLHVHTGESHDDVLWTRKNHHSTILERFQRFDLLRPDSIYVHGIHLEEQDFKLIKESGGVIALNPSSNMNNGVGLPPINQILENEIPWFVGNDGLGFGLARDYQNLIYTSMLKESKLFKLRDLHKSILTSYDYVSKRLGCKLGRIEKGYESDMMLLSYDSITPMMEENAFGHFMNGVLEQMNPKHVWTKGIQRIKDYELLEDRKEQFEEARKCAEKLWERLK